MIAQFHRRQISYQLMLLMRVGLTGTRLIASGKDLPTDWLENYCISTTSNQSRVRARVQGLGQG